jgi:predicted outer membrane repeat protein
MLKARRAAIVVAMTLGVLPVFGGAASANEWTVDSVNDTSAAACAPDPDPAPCQLRGAITAARSDSTEPLIKLLPGTYTLSLPTDTGTADNLTGDLDWADLGPDVLGDLTIQGAGSGQTTINATGLNDRILDLDGSAGGASVTVRGVTLRGGRANTAADGLDGGAIRDVMAATLTFDDVRFTDNRTLDVLHSGGAIFTRGNRIDINNVTFDDNHSARFGGAIATFTSLLAEPIVSITKSTFTQNTADGLGGGAISNMGDGAGGNLDPKVFVANSTFDGNRAVGYGGAIDTFNSAITQLGYTTVTRNQANSDGTGGEAGGGLQGGIVTVAFSLIFGNTVGAGGVNPNCSGTIDGSFGGNVSGDVTGCPGLAGTGNQVVLDAKIGPLSNNGGLTQTVPLLAGSPAIDTHSDNCVFAGTDQRGVVRPQGASCDSGAFEYAPPATTPAPAATGLRAAALKKCKKKKSKKARKKCKKKARKLPL